MKKIISILLISFSLIGYSQSLTDFFSPTYSDVRWLGIDFSHVRLIGEFSQFSGAGEQNIRQIRDKYFPAWNKLILSEPDKYNIKTMLQKNKIINDIDMLMEINSSANIDDMESYNNPNYSLSDIKDFISAYDTEGNNGIGVLFIAESLNKNQKEGFFHFVAIDMQTKEILIHERLSAKPRGFGIRNYWAGSINRIMKKIRNEKYEQWRHQYN